jgi:hypothetical protein
MFRLPRNKGIRCRTTDTRLPSLLPRDRYYLGPTGWNRYWERAGKHGRTGGEHGPSRAMDIMVRALRVVLRSALGLGGGR